MKRKDWYFRDESSICNRLIWVEETFWKWGTLDAHGIPFYFKGEEYENN